MLIEIALHRGTSLFIDGQSPAGRWTTGGEEPHGGDTTREDDGRPLEIAGLKLTAFYFDVPIGNIWECVDPKKMYLVTTEGTIEADIIPDPKSGAMVLSGNQEDHPDFDEECGSITTKLANGEDYEIDECCIFMRAKA